MEAEQPNLDDMERAVLSARLNVGPDTIKSVNYSGKTTAISGSRMVVSLVIDLQPPDTD